MTGFDYIIVGAGSAGCVIANRLSADPSVRVALIEAGPSDLGFPTNLKATLPIGNIFLLPHARYNWQYEFTGGAGVGGRAIPCPRGKMLGGCSSVNGSVYIRGHRSDYDGWLAEGNPGWGFEDVLPYFKRHERRLFGDQALHGSEGELDVQQPRAVNPLTKAFVAAAVAGGHHATDDFNGQEQDGFGVWDVNQRTGTRLSSSRAFLHPVMSRPNLTVLTDCFVERVDVSRAEATGVTVIKGGQRESLTASQEVILAGGAINSPHLLMVSGIGAAHELEKSGVRVLHDLPGVGRNLQDHPSVPIAMMDRTSRAYALSWRSLPRAAMSPLEYLVGRRGMLASNAAEGGGFFRTRPELDRPDVQVTLLAGLKGTARAIPREHGIMLLVSLLRPTSRGWLSLSSSNPVDKPVLHPAFLEAREEIKTLIAGVRETRRILSLAPISEHLGLERTPGKDNQSDEELERAIRATLSTVYHPVGTCKMGPASDAAAVVDAKLRVHGVGRLRVADASIMPNIIGGNTSAPTMMIGERVAAFILNQAQQERGLAVPRPEVVLA
ncbi:GMC family oxidoreductase N-terminal domain-containing protein [Variovorax sp. J22P168]|uniref:GMC family oxidoreductase n=1 Tax=Variovorax jilinensis TaxID=3053513 RepID=UPI002578D535|nr:GMC family oxidoreductase N-terminal domain-containing protein [Variovorax sp. J22P168]MDM0015195.1 GMC family oxidoreductase N-terminal domain-containing protein [Variovorax sp. J22P168]